MHRCSFRPHNTSRENKAGKSPMQLFCFWYAAISCFPLLCFVKNSVIFYFFMCLISLRYRVVLIKNQSNVLFIYRNFVKRKSLCPSQSITSVFLLIPFMVKPNEPFKEMFLWTRTTKSINKKVHCG